jgi:hypothetical protein
VPSISHRLHRPKYIYWIWYLTWWILDFYDHTQCNLYFKSDRNAMFNWNNARCFWFRQINKVKLEIISGEKGGRWPNPYKQYQKVPSFPPSSLRTFIPFPLTLPNPGKLFESNFSLSSGSQPNLYQFPSTSQRRVKYCGATLYHHHPSLSQGGGELSQKGF